MSGEESSFKNKSKLENYTITLIENKVEVEDSESLDFD
jgi:hypothetical protein